MSKSDTARAYYKSLRSEINIHIQLRDQALFLYLGVMGVLFGIAYSTPHNFEVLLVIPFIALGSTFVVTQHDSAIVTIAHYLAIELNDALKQEKENVVPWDSSYSLLQFETKVTLFRLWAHILIIILPVTVSLFSNIPCSWQSASPLGLVWYFGLLSALISIYVIIDAALYRHSLYKPMRK